MLIYTVLGLTVGHKLSKLVLLRKKSMLQSKLLARKGKMGRHKAIYQCFAPNPSQDHSVRGQVPHEVPTRDGKGPGVLVLDGSSHSAASWPFWGHCSSAVLLEESASQFATGNLKSGVLPK